MGEVYAKTIKIKLVKASKKRGVQHGSGCLHLELELRSKQEADASTSSYCYFRTGKPLSVCNPLQISLHHKDCLAFSFFIGISPF